MSYPLHFLHPWFLYTNSSLNCVIHKVHIYLEYHTVSVPSLELGPTPPPTLSHASEGDLPPWNQGGGGGIHSPAYEGVGSPNSDDWRQSSALCPLCGVIHKLHALRNNELIEFTCEGVRRYKFFCMVFCCFLLRISPFHLITFTQQRVLQGFWAKIRTQDLPCNGQAR